jgi:uncharacterized protein YecE (DUF72 family)
MEFGKHHSPQDIEYELQPWNSYIPPAIPLNQMCVYIGGTTWINPDWKGHLYPNKIGKGEDLKYYSRQFNSIELNSTYYGIPPLQRVKKWCEDVPDDFTFCPKFPQTISSTRIINISDNQLTRFIDILNTFGEKLGVSFFQFPTKMKPGIIISKLREFLPLMPSYLRIMFEIRHPDAYNPVNKEIIKELFYEYSHGLVITDTPGCRPIIHNLIFTATIFIRFVSCQDLQVDLMRLNLWLERLSELPSKGVKKVYFFVHEGESNPLPELALYLSDKIKPLSEYIFRGPILKDDISEQMTLF